MSTNNHSSAHSKKSSKSNHNPSVVDETAPGNAPASPLDALADATIAALDHLESKLDLNIVVPPNDKAQIGALGRVSPEAVAIAADIVRAAPSEFPHFDAAALRESADYIRAMSRVAVRTEKLLQHVQKSVLNRRYPASQQTLALYATVKGLGRLLPNESIRESAKDLAAEIKAPRHKRLTQQEKTEKRIAKQKAASIAKLEAKFAKAKGAASAPSPTPAPSAEAPGNNVVAQPAPTALPEVAVTINGAKPAALNS